MPKAFTPSGVPSADFSLPTQHPTLLAPYKAILRRVVNIPTSQAKKTSKFTGKLSTAMASAKVFRSLWVLAVDVHFTWFL